MSVNQALLTNVDRARAAWGADMPAWVRLLASACDVTNQRQVGEQLGKSSAWVSRILNRSYGAGYEEPELLVRAKFGTEDVVCPIWGPIALSTCVRNRRRDEPPRNHAHHLLAATCPTCPNNSDRREED